jgi:acetyl-CoA carboxylase biotin carboxyl carrier protein
MTAQAEKQPGPMAGRASDKQPRTDARQTISRLVDEVLPALIARLERSELGEMEVREDGWRIRLRRSSPSPVTAEAPPPQQSRSTPRPLTGPAPSASAQADRHHRPEPMRGLVASPAVGYFVARDGVRAGSAVRDGDVVGHIDVLGVRQEVVTPVAGVLREFEVEPGQAVEYGQPIVRVEAARAETDVR